MAKKAKETLHDRLVALLGAAELEMEAMRLPVWSELLERNKKAATTVRERRERVADAMRDEDEVLFMRALRSWQMAWSRVNEVLAEEYRQANPDPEGWELRYFKWMKIKFIHFDSPLGEFYLVPRAPRRQPKGVTWYTADEMIAMLEPGVAATILGFKKLPVRFESLSGPAKGEQHMHIDLTGPETVVKCDLWKGGRYGGAGVR